MCFWLCVSSFPRRERVTHTEHYTSTVWIVTFCVNCNQNQVILLNLLQDWRNLLVAWVMLLDVGGTLWTKHVVPTRVDWCGYVLYSTQKCNTNCNRTCSTRGHGKKNISLQSCVRSQGDAAVERMLDPIEGSHANPWQELWTFFADDLFGKVGTEME